MIVDERMRTSDPAIFAAGDVAEFDRAVLGLWPTAVEQAEVAAENALGGDKAYAGSVPVTILKVVGIELTSIGRFEPAAARRGGHRARGRVRPALPQAGDRRRRPHRRRDPARLLARGRPRADRDRARLGRARPARRLLRAGRWDQLKELSGDQPLLAGAPASSA